MSAFWVAFLPAASGIIAAIGTILIARWTQEGQQKVFLTEKVDEIVDERVAELKADRDAIKTELKLAEQERHKLFSEQGKLRESNALLRSKISEIQLHREQAINRMRRELSASIQKNTVLLAKCSELETQLNLSMQENQQLRQQINELQQRQH